MATPPKKPTTRRTATRKPAAGATAGKAADKATGAAGATKAASPRKAPARKPAARKPTTSKIGQVKAAVKSAPHNVAEKVEATAKRAREKSPVGLKTAIAAGIGAVGAVATAALLTLRGSSKPEPTKSGAGKPAAKPRKAKQADGTDSSKSIAAGIADEGSIPQD